MNWAKKNWITIAIVAIIIIIYYYMTKKTPKGIKIDTEVPTLKETSSSQTSGATTPTTQPQEKTEAQVAEETAKWAADMLSKTKSFNEFKDAANRMDYVIIQDREPESGGFDPSRIRVSTAIGTPREGAPMQKIITSIISVG